MPIRRTPSAGGKPDKLIRNALMVAVNREAKGADGQPTKKLALIAEKLVELAVEGDVQAIKEIGDRIDGKPTQALEHELGLSLEDLLDRLAAGSARAS